MINEDDHWQMLMPSYYARGCPELLDELERELRVDRGRMAAIR